MKFVMIGSKYYNLFDITEMHPDLLNIHQNIAIKMDNAIFPIARNEFEPGLLYRDARLFTTLTNIPYRVGEVVDIPTDKNNISIKDIIDENESSRDLTFEYMSTTTADNIFVPRTTGMESAEMKILKDAITEKKIDINKYEDRFFGKFQNDKRLLNKNTISLDKLKTIANALDMEVSMTIKDKNKNIPNPMNKTFTAIITDVDSE